MSETINTAASSSSAALEITIGGVMAPPIFELPLLTTGITGKKRKPHVILGMRPVVFAAEEFSLEEAPIVAIYHNKIIARSGDGRFFHRLCDRPDPLNFNYANERLRSLFDALGFNQLRRDLLFRHGENRFHVPMRPNTPPGAVRLSNLDELSIRDRSEELINQQMQAFETFVASLAMIGDGLYVCCDEPHIIVRELGRGYIHARVSISLGDSRSTLSDKSFLGLYPITKLDVIQATFEPLNKAYDGKILTSDVTIYEPTLFSEGFPVENAALMAQEVLKAWGHAMADAAEISIMRLRAVGEEGIVLLDEIRKALVSFEADNTNCDPLVRYVGDLLELPDDAPIWRLLDRNANLNHAVNFVREQLEAMEITLDLHPHFESSYLRPGSA